MTDLSEAQLKEFQELLDWTSGSRLPDGRIVGNAQRCFGEEAWMFAFIRDRLDPAGKTILELGACDGQHTVALSRICRRVVALEVRPRNVLCALARLCLHEVDNAQVILKDVSKVDASIGAFDLIYHTGVLYHLRDPVRHLFSIAPVADTIFLGTHYAEPSAPPGPRADLDDGGRSWPAYVYPELGWGDPLSGVEASSRWLPRDALLGVLVDAGYAHVEVIRESSGNGHPWIDLLAQR
jgi:tRNA (mo5U34)-methyltransferase